MKKFKRHLYSAAAASVVMVSGAQAKLPFTDINGSTKYFKNPLFSPLSGAAAIDAGIIESIRFNMAEIIVLDAEGDRLYQDDKSSDPHWNLVKLLFPSNAGILSTDTGASTSANKYVTPETVALFMQFIDEVRQGKPVGGKKGIKEAYKLRFKKLAVSMAALSMNDKDKTALTSDGGAFAQLVNNVMGYIAQAILNEQKERTIFPKYTTEQIISGFFCMNFHGQKDIEEYILALQKLDNARRIVNDLSVSQGPSSSNSTHLDLKPLEIEDIQNILVKLKKAIELPTLEELHSLEVAQYFYSPIPYKEGDPISNGHTNFVSGPGSQVIKGGTFQDCNEETLRHLLNMFLFDPLTKKFHISFLDKIPKNARDNPRLRYLQEFYAYQDMFKTDNGSTLMRTLWNRVVGDLNTLSAKGPRIRYAYNQGDSENELESGFINIIRVFERLFGVNFLPKLSEGSAIDSKMIEESFIKLFNFLAPEKRVQLDVSAIKYSPEKEEFFGEMSVTVDEKFSFDIEEGNVHGEINEIQFLENIPIVEAIDKGIEENKNIFKRLIDSPALVPFQTLFLLSEKTKHDVDNMFYGIMSCDLSDNKGIIKFIELVNKSIKNGGINEKNAGGIMVLLKNSLVEFAWDDVHMLQRLVPHLITLYIDSMHAPFSNKLRGSFMELFHDKVKGIGVDGTQMPPELINHILHSFRNLEILGLDNVDISSVPMETREKLRILRVVNNNDTSFDRWDDFKNIEALDLKEAHLEKITFTDPRDKLSYLTLPKDLEELTTRHELPLFTRFALTEKARGNYDLNMPKLKKFSIVHGDGDVTKPLNVKGHFPDLEELQVWEVKIDLFQLTAPMPKLKKFQVSTKNTLFTDWENLCAVEELVYWGRGDIAFEHLPALTKINLKYIEDINKLEVLKNLETIQLVGDKIAELYLSTSLECVKNFYNISSLERFEGWEYLPALEHIILDNNRLKFNTIPDSVLNRLQAIDMLIQPGIERLFTHGYEKLRCVKLRTDLINNTIRLPQAMNAEWELRVVSLRDFISLNFENEAKQIEMTHKRVCFVREDAHIDWY